MGVLKLNFDGSYIQSVSIGVIGGIIRDWNDNVVGAFWDQWSPRMLMKLKFLLFW